MMLLYSLRFSQLSINAVWYHYMLRSVSANAFKDLVTKLERTHFQEDEEEEEEDPAPELLPPEKPCG